MPKPGSTIITGLSASLDMSKRSFIKIIYQVEEENIDSFFMPAAECVSFIESFETHDSSTITIQSGVRIHTKFHLDISTLDFFNCINSAEISLFIDELNSDFREKQQNDTSVFLAYFGDSTLTEQHKNIKTRILGQYDPTEQQIIFRLNGHETMNYILRKNNGIGELILMNSSPILEHNSFDK